ncbi:MAG: bifunctional protein-serine/threonine kinase/phosphatase [Cellvibrionaceae bacterium]
MTDSSAQLDVSFGGYSIAGVKSTNEDAFAAHLPSLGVRYLKGAVACIADGVSCSENAQRASQTSVTQFIEDYYSTPDAWPVKTAAARVLSSMNSWLYHYGQQSSLPHNGLVTTFSAVVCKSTTAHLFHVGDSRIYRLRSSRIEQITRDHSHKQVGSKVFLTRALGMDSRLEVDYLQEELEQDDLFILTTDGVHDYISKNTLEGLFTEEFSASTANDSESLEKVAKKIVETALSNGSEDNISCLLCHVKELPTEQIDEVYRKLTELKIPPAMSPGMSIDGFEILSVVHSGTRSHVYLASKKDSEKKFILKAPSENFSDDPQYLDGFFREQWVGKRIDNSRVMKIYERPESSPFLYHVCEYIPGQTLRQWMYDNPNPKLEVVRELAKSIIFALRVFQRLGMTHRDLKPENIILDENNQAKIIDFGTVLVEGLEEITSPLSEEIPVGSVDYIAPEYLLGSIHPSSDLFSVGVIIYEMLCGHLPYKESTAQRYPKRFAEWRFRSILGFRKDIPVWMGLALKKATEPDPRNRYQAFSEFLHDISTPNESLISKQQQVPLIERNPVLFWQVLSSILFLVILIQFVRN